LKLFVKTKVAVSATAFNKIFKKKSFC